jgi:hypothetical protein
MNLSTLIGSGANPYLEYGWVTAPNTTGQGPFTANAITTLTIDTEVADTGNFGSIASNQITLAAGTYYFEANAPIVNAAGNYLSFILSLRKNVTTTPVIVSSVSNGFFGAPISITILKGQFTIATSTVFDLTAVASVNNGNIWNGMTSSYVTPFSNATAGADQRTTLKLWKLA